MNIIKMVLDTRLAYERGKLMAEFNQKKQRIINAAVEILKEKPMEQITVRKIASKAGLTTGALYHHYKNKDEIIFDVITKSFRFTNELEDQVKDSSEEVVKEQLLQRIIFKVHSRLSDKEQQKLNLVLLVDVIMKSDNNRQKYKVDYEGSIERTANLFSKAFQIEESSKKKIMASILIAAIDGFAIQQSLGCLPEDEEKAIDNFIDFFVSSIPYYLEKNSL